MSLFPPEIFVTGGTHEREKNRAGSNVPKRSLEIQDEEYGERERGIYQNANHEHEPRFELEQRRREGGCLDRTGTSVGELDSQAATTDLVQPFRQNQRWTFVRPGRSSGLRQILDVAPTFEGTSSRSWKGETVSRATGQCRVRQTGLREQHSGSENFLRQPGGLALLWVCQGQHSLWTTLRQGEIHGCKFCRDIET